MFDNARVQAALRLADAGFTIPGEYLALHQRYTDFVNTPRDQSAAEIARRITAGEPVPDELRAAGVIEHINNPMANAALDNTVAATIATQLEQILKPAIGQLWSQACESFDAAAQKLTTAMSLIDPDLPAEQAVQLDAKKRSAWGDIPLMTNAIDNTIPALHDALLLQGGTAHGDAGLLGLCAQVGTVPRRLVWQAWNSSHGRAGRWGSLIGAGITVKVNRDAAGIIEYAPPQPLEQKIISTGGYGKARTEYHDRETGEIVDPHTLQTIG
jgi:hypothetical protein